MLRSVFFVRRPREVTGFFGASQILGARPLSLTQIWDHEYAIAVLKWIYSLFAFKFFVDFHFNMKGPRL